MTKKKTVALGLLVIGYWLLVIGYWLLVIIVAWIGVKIMSRIAPIETVVLEERGRLPVGRASLGLYDGFVITGRDIEYNGIVLEGSKSVSESSFNKWVNRRWQEIMLLDERRRAEKPPQIYRLSPSKVMFKYNYFGDESGAYNGEGAIWFNNKMLLIAPGGDYSAHEIIPSIMANIKELEGEGQGFCLDFYCLDVPKNKKETAGLVVNFTKYPGVYLGVGIKNYTSAQRKYYSERMPNGGIAIDSVAEAVNLFSRLTTTYYVDAKKCEVDGVIGELDIFGETDEVNANLYRNSIQARWYHPGTSTDPSDPEIDITLMYEFTTDHAPTKKGWFDNETVRQTDFSPEKFMSIWEATLKGFKRQS